MTSVMLPEYNLPAWSQTFAKESSDGVGSDIDHNTRMHSIVDLTHIALALLRPQ